MKKEIDEANNISLNYCVSLTQSKLENENCLRYDTVTALWFDADSFYV